MKNLKKTLIAGAAVLTAASLASCGSTEATSVPQNNVETDKAEIIVWATAKEEPVINKVIEDYNKDHEKKFKITFKAVAEGDAGTTLKNDPQTNGAPALFLCADDQIADLASSEIIAEMKGARRERIISSMTEASVQGATLDDKLYGYPVTNDNGYFLWYDSTQLTAQNVLSLEEILSVAEQKGKKVLMDVGNGWYANSFIMSPDACGTNSLYWTRNDKKVSYTATWDNEVGVRVSEYIGALLHDYKEKGVLLTGDNSVIANKWTSGDLIAAVSGTWMEGELKTACEATEGTLAATKLPSYHIDGKAYQMASFSGSKVYCINKTQSPEEQRTAAELAELLTTKEAQLYRFETRQTLPCNKEAVLDARYTEHVTIGGKALVEQTAFSCVQSKTAEGRYWSVGEQVGLAYLNGADVLKDAAGNSITWQQFLTTQMSILRAAQ